MSQRLRKGFKEQLVEDIRQAIGGLVADHGFEVTLSTPRHNNGVMSFTVKLISGGEAAYHAQQYIEHCKKHSMEPSWLGKQLTLPNDDNSYILAGWDQRKKKLKVILMNAETGEPRLESPESIAKFANFLEDPSKIDT